MLFSVSCSNSTRGNRAPGDSAPINTMSQGEYNSLETTVTQLISSEEGRSGRASRIKSNECKTTQNYNQLRTIHAEALNEKQETIMEKIIQKSWGFLISSLTNLCNLCAIAAFYFAGVSLEELVYYIIVFISIFTILATLLFVVTIIVKIKRRQRIGYLINHVK